LQQYRWVAFCYRQLCCRSNADSRNVHRQYTFHSATNYKETDYHTHRLARQNFYPDLGSGTNCRDERVYLFVSLSASISQKLHVQSSPIFYTLPAAVARSSTGGVAICYMLPVIRKTSCLRIMTMNIQRLQSVQNAAARLIFNLRRCDHITDALISLHWLRVPERITFKVATLTYRALHGSAPPYLASSFTCVADMPHRRRFRSASTEQLDVPTCRRSTMEVVPFLLLEQRCVMACQAKLRRPRRCRCSGTG